jgi:phosphoribosylformylglycinamidine synthase
LNLTASVAQRAVDATAFQLEAKTPDDLNGSPTTSAIEGEHGLGQVRRNRFTTLYPSRSDSAQPKGWVSGRIPLALLVIVPRYQARVLVHLRPSVLDPAGEATKGAAIRLGVDGISKLRIGKAVELDIDAPNEEEARRRLELLSDRLLANPVIENWSLELTDS